MKTFGVTSIIFQLIAPLALEVTCTKNLAHVPATVKNKLIQAMGVTRTGIVFLTASGPRDVADKLIAGELIPGLIVTYSDPEDDREAFTLEVRLMITCDKDIAEIQNIIKKRTESMIIKGINNILPKGIDHVHEN